MCKLLSSSVNTSLFLCFLFLFTLQDMCVVCGSFGKGAEGQLLACAQCAQCYHPYCVNSKVNIFFKFVLQFGFCRKTDTDLNVLRRSQRRSFVRAGAAWNASSAKCVGRRRTPPGFCCATTVTSVITPTAWTHHCTMSQRAVGSANGTNTSLLRVRRLVESSDFK